MDLFFYGLLIILVGSVIVSLFPNLIKRPLYIIVSLVGSIIIFSSLYRVTIGDTFNSIRMVSNFHLFNIEIIFDELTIFFIIISTIIYLIIEFFIILNKEKITIYNIIFNILFVIILFLIIFQNSFFFLIFWELLSFFSFFLIMTSNTPHSRRIGVVYLVAAHISLVLLTIAFGILINETGSYYFSNYITFFSSNSPLSIFVFCLFFIGFAIKAKFVPFHSYFTSIYPYIDFPTLATLSVCVINVSLYGILRFVSFIKTPPLILSYTILFLSICSAIYGITYATISKNVRNILGYSSVENVGIIGIALSIGMIGLSIGNSYLSFLGFAAVFLHIVNHSFFKTTLSLSMCNISKGVNLDNIDKLGGLNKIFPFTTKIVIFSIIAIACLPPLNGFISEFVIYIGLLESIKGDVGMSIIGLILTIALLSLVGGIAIICFSRFFGIIFLGEYRGKKDAISNINENPFLVFPIVILTLPIILIGLFPLPVFEWISNILTIYINGDIDSYVLKLSLTLKTIGLVNQIFFAIFIPLAILRYIIIRKNGIDGYKTWDCGFQQGTSRIQYNGSSFVEPFVYIIKPFIPITIRKSNLNNIFNSGGFYKKSLKDFFYIYLVKPIGFLVEKILSLVSWIQNGNTQLYLLFSLIFLVIMIIFAIQFR